MQVNRYDRPAEAPILNTYVPINFGELYRIGAAQNQAIDQAAQQFGAQLQKFGEFRSPSQVDTERWYNLTTGREDVQNAVNQMVSNPDALKDAAFRAGLQSIINSTDYAALSTLQQSREGMLQRQKANQELMLRGLYNPLWHDVDYSSYDTSAAGIYNDVSPLAYKSEVDLVKPFVDNLKASFMGVENGWIRQGVSQDRTDYEIQKNLSSIQNTPEYMKHLEVLQRQGLSREEAENQLNRTLITAGREFAYEQRERDPWWMKSMELQRRNGNADTPNKLSNLTTQIYKDSRRKIYENFTSLAPEEMDLLVEKGVGVLPPSTREVLRQELNPDAIQDKLRSSFDMVLQHTGDRNAAVNYVIDTFSSPLSPKVAFDTFGKYGTTGVKNSNGNYKATDSSNFILEDEIAFSMMGDENQAGTRTLYNSRFADMWNNGKFHDFLIAPETTMFTDGSRAYQKKFAYVPIEQFDTEDFFTEATKEDESALSKILPSFITGRKKDKETRMDLQDAIEQAGLVVTTLDEAGPINSITVRTDNNDNVDSKSVNSKTYKQYVRVPVATVIPHRGEASVSADSDYTVDRRLRTETNEIQNRISEAERFPYSNLDGE